VFKRVRPESEFAAKTKLYLILGPMLVSCRLLRIRLVGYVVKGVLVL
jgi:hypothetical protein